jgi:hypothetical protein
MLGYPCFARFPAATGVTGEKGLTFATTLIDLRPLLLREKQLSSREGLSVRIRLPPADSPSLAGFLPSVSKSRQLPRRARARPDGMAGRDAQGSSTSRQLPVTSLSGPFSVPQCRQGRFATGVAVVLSELGSPRDLVSDVTRR